MVYIQHTHTRHDQSASCLLIAVLRYACYDSRTLKLWEKEQTLAEEDAVRLEEKWKARPRPFASNETIKPYLTGVLPLTHPFPVSL